MKTTINHLSVAKFLAVLGLSTIMLPASADAAKKTFCQENGHGANGCSDLFAGGGYCWASTDSTTGYVCREDDPKEGIEPIESVSDPVLLTPGGDSGEIEALEIVICGPDNGAGCFTWAIPNVCCDDLGLSNAEPMGVGGATITCYD